MAGAPTKGFPVPLLYKSLLYKPSHAAPRKGHKTSKPGSDKSGRPEASQLRQAASLRRGTATRQAAFRAARRRQRTRRSKVAASSVPLLLLGSVSVPALAWAATAGGSNKPAPGAASAPAGTTATSFDGRPRPIGGDWSVQQPAAWTAPPTTTAPSKPPVSTTGTAVVVSAQGKLLGTFVVTCYDIQGRTASGASTSPVTVAVDPRVIPLGTQIYIDGVGQRVAQDTGGAIVGKRLDIWEPTYAQCAAWGVETRQVWLG